MSALRRARVDGRLSIVELSELSGVSQEQIRNLERGRATNPRAETLDKLAQALGCNPSDIDPFPAHREPEAPAA